MNPQLILEGLPVVTTFEGSSSSPFEEPFKALMTEDKQSRAHKGGQSDMWHRTFVPHRETFLYLTHPVFVLQLQALKSLICLPVTPRAPL